MTIEICAGTNTAEDRAARRLGEMIQAHDPEVAESGRVQVCVIAGVQCYGQSPQDIDLVLLINDGRDTPFTSESGVRLESCCVAVELKSHTTEGVLFRGAECYVRYGSDEHNVSRQSESQKWSLRRYLSEQTAGPSPFVGNLIWLEHVPAASLPTVATNLLGADATWQDLIEAIVRVTQRGGLCRGIPTTRAYFDAVSTLTKRLEPSSLDRRKLEAVCQRLADSDTQYLQRMGEQLLIFRGRGGTGKTIRLLRLAYHLYRTAGARALILTYNKALQADISRLLALLRIQDGVGEPVIGVRTIHYLLRHWMLGLDVLSVDAGDFLDRYERLKRELIDCLNGGAISEVDVRVARGTEARDLAWDYIFVDECQDWPSDERDLLFKLYDFNRFVLADGIDQLVRSEQAIDWREGLEKRQTQVVSLRRSLRLKSALCTVVNSVADELGIAGWDLEPEPQVHGGKLIVLDGNAYTAEFHRSLLQTLEASRNKPIEMLICVPPELVTRSEDGNRNSEVALSLRSWGYEVWDGTSETVRATFPTSLRQHRIVQYESCRGLEGWTVVCLGLERLYDRKAGEYVSKSRDDVPGLCDFEAEAFASRWIMIPLTRAIDTLVVQVSDPKHRVYQALHRARQAYPELVEWRLA